MVKVIKTHQNDVISKKITTQNLIHYILEEVNQYIKEDAYDSYQHHNKNALD